MPKVYTIRVHVLLGKGLKEGLIFGLGMFGIWVYRMISAPQSLSGMARLCCADA